MRRSNVLRAPSRAAAVLALVAWVLSPIAPARLRAEEPAEEGAATSVVFLVRHAEKQGGADPELSERGRARAERLAALLSDASIDRIFSTDTQRTLGTARPLAERRGLEVEIYDPGTLAELAETLRAVPGRHLVVGHSNTTPALVGLLGGEPGSPIEEAGEFDRLYVLTLVPGAAPTTVLLRYGGSP